MRPTATHAYVVLALGAVTAAVLSFPDPRAGPLALALLTAGAIGFGTWYHGLRRRPWLLLAAGAFTLGAGAALRAPAGVDAEPLLADVLDLGGLLLVACAVGVVVKLRSPRGDWPAFVDSAILTTGSAVVLWTFLVEPYLEGAGHAVLEQAVHVAEPLAVLALTAATVRLMVGPGPRPLAYDVLTAGLLAVVAGAVAHGTVGLEHGPAQGRFVDLALLVGLLCLGVAPLQEGARAITEAPSGDDPERRFARLAVLGAAILSVPGVLVAAQALELDSGWVVPTVGSVVLYLLVLARMARLLSEQERAAEREAILRDAATALSAVRRERIAEIALDGARRLVAGLAGGTVRMIVANDRDGDSLLRHGVTEVKPVPTWMRRRLNLSDDAVRVVLVPFIGSGTPRGGIAAASSVPFPRGLRNALDSLGRQVGLALEAAELNERLFKQRSEARFRSLVQNSTDVITVTGADTTIRYQTPSVVTVLGYEPDDLADTKLSVLVHEDDRAGFLEAYQRLVAAPGSSAAFELRIMRRDGRPRRAELIATNLLEDPTVEGIVLTLRDVTERRQLEERLAHQAFHDALTGLANRALFVDRVEHALSRRSRIAVLFVDLDDFKNVNDSLGHEEGDRLLVEVAERIGTCLRPQDTVARLGGDEFAILLEDVNETADAIRVAQRLSLSFEEPFALSGHDVRVGASVGVAISSLATRSATELLRDADVAMYRAKSAGKGHYEIFEQGMHEEALRRFELGAELRRAIDVPELVLHYQPIVDLRTQYIVAAEALVRWEHPERGLLAPGEFIPLAEETGLVRAIDGLALVEACKQARMLQEAYIGRPLQITVNVSARTLEDPVLLLDVEDAIRQAGIEPGSLVLELTESALMQSFEQSIQRLKALRGLGVQVAIDDFGTGYSSLSYLRDMPVDILKVAKPFVDGMARSPDDLKLAAVIVDLASKFDLRTIAEGVESVSQRELLRELGCDMAQGYHFGKPLTSDSLRDLLRMVPVPGDALPHVPVG